MSFFFLWAERCWSTRSQSQTRLCASWFLPPQLEASGCEPLDELYDALAEVVGAEETMECYKSYLLVPHTENPQCHCYLYIKLFVLCRKNITIWFSVWIARPYFCQLLLAGVLIWSAAMFVSCSLLVALWAWWRTLLWSQRGPPGWWRGRRLFTWQSGLWRISRSLQAGKRKDLQVVALQVELLQLLDLLLLLQDGAGAGQRCGVDGYHRLSVVQPEAIHLQRLSLHSAAETQRQRPAEWAERADDPSGQRGEAGLDGNLRGRAEGDQSWCHHRRRSDFWRWRGHTFTHLSLFWILWSCWQSAFSDLELKQIPVVCRGADVVYDPDIAGSLAKLLSIVLRCSSAEGLPQVFICSTIRNLETYGGFKQQLGKTALRRRRLWWRWFRLIQT